MRNAAASRLLGLAGWPASIAAIALVLWLVHLDRRPEPVYADQFTHPEAAAVLVTALLPLEVSFELAERPSAVRVPVWIGPEQRPLEIRLDVAAIGSEPTTSRARIEEPGLARVPVPPGPTASVRLTVVISSDARSREQAPSVLWARDDPRLPLDVRYAGRPLEAVSVLPPTGPLFLLEYDWPARGWLALWGGVLAALPWAWHRDPRRRAAFLAVLALAATATSSLLWQRDYTRRAAHLDADQYAESAERMAVYVREPSERPRITEWFRAYPHASTQLVPALLVPLILLGWPSAFAYALLSALAAWLALLVVQRIAVTHLAVPAGLGVLAAAACACHPLMLRSFARPVTDSAGLLLVLLTLAVLLRRIRSLDWRGELWLSCLVLLHPLARPQGFGYWPFIALALVWADHVREGGWPGMRQLVARAMRVFAVPVLVLGLLHVQLDWSHNVELMLAKARRFRIDSTPGDFVASLIGIVQALPLLGLIVRRPGAPRLRSDPAVRLLVAWAIYAIGLLVAVRAPYWLRHFLPALPVVYWLAGMWIRDLVGVRRTIAIGGVVALASANVALTLWQVAHLESLPPFIAALTTVP